MPRPARSPARSAPCDPPCIARWCHRTSAGTCRATTSRPRYAAADHAEPRLAARPQPVRGTVDPRGRARPCPRRATGVRQRDAMPSLWSESARSSPADHDQRTWPRPPRPQVAASPASHASRRPTRLPHVSAPSVEGRRDAHVAAARARRGRSSGPVHGGPASFGGRRPVITARPPSTTTGTRRPARRASGVERDLGAAGDDLAAVVKPQAHVEVEASARTGCHAG